MCAGHYLAGSKPLGGGSVHFRIESRPGSRRRAVPGNRQSRDKDDSIVALLQDFQKMAGPMLLQGLRAGLRGRLHSSPPAWLSTQLTGLATLKRARFIRLSQDIWKRSSPDSASGTGKCLRSSSANFVPSSSAACSSEVLFGSTAMIAAWTALYRIRVIRSGKLSAVHRRGQAILCDLARDPLQIVSGQRAKQ
jgi:hypothetical protein